MRNTLKIAVVAGALLAGTGGIAQADSHIRYNVSIGVGAPVVYAPAPAYYPVPAYYGAPVVYAPRVVYAAPPAYYGPVVYAAPVRYYGRPYYRHNHWR